MKLGANALITFFDPDKIVIPRIGITAFTGKESNELEETEILGR